MKRLTFQAASMMICLFLFASCSHENLSESGAGIRYTPDEPVYWSGELEADHASGIKIPGFSALYFPADCGRVQMTLANPEENACYFVYTLHLDSPDGEVLYTSCKIQPGMAVTELTLNRSLSEGVYTLYIYVSPYDCDSGQLLNSAQMKVPLTVVAE